MNPCAVVVVDSVAVVEDVVEVVVVDWTVVLSSVVDVSVSSELPQPAMIKPTNEVNQSGAVRKEGASPAVASWSDDV